MKLTPVIAALRARCPYFENRVAGAAQFKNLPEVGKLRLPAAYVVPGDDSPGENKSQTDYWQELKEGFSVVVILSNPSFLRILMFVKPVKGRSVPDPARGDLLPAEGRNVDENNYWLRREVAGDIRRVNKKVNTDDDKL